MSVSWINLHIRRWQRVYHKLVKTTPNPSATKNSSGELVGPLPPPPPLPVLVAGLFAVAVPVLVAEEIMEDIVEC